MPTELSAERAVDAARTLLDEALRSGSRRMLGIAGAPGAGKSTLAARLAEQLGTQAVLVPMDGFHLADVALGAGVIVLGLSLWTRHRRSRVSADSAAPATGSVVSGS